MSGAYLTLRMLKLPAEIRGPKTRWFIRLEYYGKNGGKAALMARCVSNGNAVKLYDGGRARVTEGGARCGFLVCIGTIQCKIAAAAVAQGVAEFVGQDVNGFASPFT